MAGTDQNHRPLQTSDDDNGGCSVNIAAETESLLLNLDEAATLLGYKPIGLRKIVDRSRAKAQGRNVTGPTIRFFQTCKCAPIKFRREWLDEFIERHSVDPGETESETTPGAANGKTNTPGRGKCRSQFNHGF